MPAAAPANFWFGPLLLIDQTPASLIAEIPCTLPPALHPRAQEAIVLSTARKPERTGGLAVLREGRALVVEIGGAEVARIELQNGSSSSHCQYTFRTDESAWSLTGGPRSVTRSGTLERAPRVSGFFSDLDLRLANRPRVVLATTLHAGPTTTRQRLAWSIAVLAAVTALFIVALDALREAAVRQRPFRRSVVAPVRPVDLLVGTVLFAWWIISPANVDDGWIFAREHSYSQAGGFTNYYDALGANLPSDYWVEWIQHWLAQASSALLVLRVPALLCLVATWFVCRWTLSRCMPSDRKGDAGQLVWVLASAFLAGAVAWDMTLRPEPITALLATCALACAVAFRRGPSVIPLALAAVLVPLALTAHYTGVVVLAPLLAISPGLLSWGRQRLSTSVTLITSSVALLVVLATVGSDFGQRLADARTTRAATSSPQDAWYDELARYERLDDVFFATPLRRGAVALIFLVALMFVFRRVRIRSEIDLPARALIISLPLLFVTWGKLPWHFGALIGLAAVAASTESLRLRREAQRASGISVRPYVFCVAGFLAAGWAWVVRGPWAPIDLGTLSWGSDVERVVPLDVIASLLPVLALAALLLRGIAVHNKALYSAPWNVAALTAPLLVVPLLSVTVLVFALDTAMTGSWTLGRQNLETLSGAGKCGLADDVAVTSRNVAGGQSLAELLAKERVRTFVNPNRLMYFPCVRVPRIHDGIAEPPEFVIAPWQKNALPVAYKNSPFIGLLDAYRLRPLGLGGSGPWRQISVYAVERMPGSRELEPTGVTARQ